MRALVARAGRRATSGLPPLYLSGVVRGAVILAGFFVALYSGRATAQEGDSARGKQAFRACAACHSVTPNRNMTGPSLAGVWNRRAGSLASFPRYSAALKNADLAWDDTTLDAWLAGPEDFIPGNAMTFPGVKNDRARADIVAYLKTLPAAGGVDVAGGGGMMGGGSQTDLKQVGDDRRVQAIALCGDTYRVRTADGKVAAFWEQNLRFKTDSGESGPAAKAPAILPGGMMGDRASVIFASPEEMAEFVKKQCP